MNQPLAVTQEELYSLRRKLEKEGVIVNEADKTYALECIVNTERAIDRIGKIVNSIKNQIRNESNDENNYFSIAKLVEGTNLLMNNYLTERGCKLVINVNEDINIHGEANELDRVITNIIKNSMEAYSSNGSGGEINIDVAKVDGNCAIKIKDFAGGIEEEVAQKLFKQMTSTKGSEGTGFGLYYSYQIITGKFGGTIDLETKLGEGTVFTITIPVEEEK